MESADDKFMRRCIELAMKAEGRTRPNPMVGSVIVHGDMIIGEGYHLRAGMSHAEVNAVNSVSDKGLLKESTLFVNLEPCSHFGKTPPCADLIIRFGIPRVVIGTGDTSARVNGEGIRKLMEAGCEVITGVLGEESRWLNRRFFTFHEKKRPYIILKWAETPDGFIDVVRTEDMEHRPTWISGKPERVLVHKWRSEEDAILAGAGTIRADRARLNVREWSGTDPVKIVLSSSGRLDQDAPVFTGKGVKMLFTHNPRAVIPGTETLILDEDRPSCFQVADYLYEKGIQSLFIEGGFEVLEHFISNGLWDEARVFTGKENFRQGIKGPELSGKLTGRHDFRGSTLLTYVNE